jgi:hypothetical protein
MPMYDSGKIITGLVIFVIIITFPIWYNVGGAEHLPNPEKPVGKKQCVRDTQYMRTTHMQLLSEWRDEVVRDGNRQDQIVDGIKYEKSLQNGCMNCHTSKKKFCDECHIYAAVKPYCWDCHVQPKEMN